MPDKRRPRPLVRWWERIVNALSFSRELYRLQRELNARIDAPEAIGPSRRGQERYNKHFRTRRISIAEAYLMVVRELDSQKSKSRLRALRMLAEASFHSKTVTMPLNTARVQMNLMKEAIKCRHDRRRQLELLSDFTDASYGRGNTIRKLCREHNIIQVPEIGAELGDLDLGWDDHVHDTSSTGRKNPTQLVIDAFIKGVSEVTIAHSTTSVSEMMDEALSAGRTLGVKVTIALDFSVNVCERRFHFAAVMPDVQHGRGARAFLKANRRELGDFLKGLRENQKHRIVSVKSLVDNFNQTFLPELNSGYHDDPYLLPRLKMSAIESYMPLDNVNRTHLGEFLYSLYRPVLQRRELYHRAQRERALHELHGGTISEWDYQVVERMHREIRNEIAAIAPDVLERRYFTNPLLADHPTVFEDLSSLSDALRSCGCHIKVIHPLEHGIERAKRLIEQHADYIDQVEIYNMDDSVNRDPEEILRFAAHVNDQNTTRAVAEMPIVVPVCGSDAAGRSPNIPGMGFILEDRVTRRDRRNYAKRHVVLPALVSRMIIAGSSGDPARDDGPTPRIISMGKVVSRVGPKRSDGGRGISATAGIGIGRAVRYLSPVLKNLLLIAAGFAFAFWYIGIDFAVVWFGITAVRHFVTDAAARRGFRLREWTTRSVDFGNMSRSLFFTGLSVPILGFIKQGFDFIWPLAHFGILFNFARFFAISLANGTYLVLHNRLRGFESTVIRANFFRSAISWPFASLFAPVGDLLRIPTIVQAKFWSDFVGGVIEGTGKFVRQLRLRRRDVEELLPLVFSSRERLRNNAILDLLFIFRADPRTRNSLHSLFRSEKEAQSEGRNSLRRLQLVLERRELHSELVRFAVTMRNEEIASDIIDLIGETLPELTDWINAQSKPGRSAVQVPVDQKRVKSNDSS